MFLGSGHATPALAVWMDNDRDAITRSFESCDLNGDGLLSHIEFFVLMRVLFKECNKPCPPQEALAKMYDAADANRNGAVDYHELIGWLFTEDNPHDCNSPSGNGETDRVSPTSEGEVDGQSSSSSSSEGEAEGSQEKRFDKAATIAKEKRCIARSLKHEEPVTTMEEMYELLTTVRGKITGLLRLQVLVENFARCKEAQMGPLLARLIPQECGDDYLAEDVSPMELGHLYALVKEKPEATAEDAAAVIQSVKDVCRRMETVNVEALGLDEEDPVGFSEFQRLIGFLQGTMKIDRSLILATMAWAKTDRFELTECMAITLMDKLFLAHEKDGKHILETPIKNNDFIRMCYGAGLVDNSERDGIGRAHLEIMFTNMLKHLPKRRFDREKRRKHDLGKKPRRRKHVHSNIRGRTELAILIEELYRAIPNANKTYASPLHLCLRLLEGSGGKRKRLHH